MRVPYMLLVAAVIGCRDHAAAPPDHVAAPVPVVVRTRGDATGGIASDAARPLPTSIGKIPTRPWAPPKNTVALTRLDGETFYVDKTEVTVKAYRACVDAQACSPPASGEREPDPRQRAVEDKEGTPHTCPPASM